LNAEKIAFKFSEPALLPFPPEILEKSFRRKAMIALYESGINTAAIAIFMHNSEYTVRRCVDRHLTGNEGLDDHPRSGRPAIYTEDAKLRITAFYCQTHPLKSCCGRWTLRWAEQHLKANPERIKTAPSKSTILRILKNNKLKPHLSSYFLHITDPNFFPKMEHLLSLYKKPPRFLFFFDESPCIQILKRLNPDIQTDDTKRRLEEFEYIRNGTMDVFAFLNNADGTVYSECHKDHKTDTFIEVFRRHVVQYSKSETLHYVMDNLASHCSYKLCKVIAEHSGIECPSEKDLQYQAQRVEWLRSETKRIVLHFTPYHGSWLNQVEIWFSIMGKKVLNESFCSPESFKSAYDSFVEEWNLFLAHPFKWTYEGDGLKEKAVKRFTKMLSSSSRLEVPVITKGLGLMSNLLKNDFINISQRTWKEFIEMMSSQYNTIFAIINNEDGPIKKKKAKKALLDFIEIVFERLSQDITAAA